ncbi:hypothetical protein [Halalkalibacter nanhaiisediminis]|uniref:Uncharacterized protein n=1 Tax=Halalkalibacter nanhaiisediminis TaxID=688079 RepID=A0A562QCY4_9BACI|nr:hypothetical protein [Halalkalibacter nanhaiisediminis]TWI54611.1 hypothetical protein IQ10_02832 [Halalkalibacter nanhaiisediminis]
MVEKRSKQDQAIMLRQQMEHYQTEDRIEKEEKQSLPPRAKYHKQRKQKLKVKFSFPLIRLLVLLFFVLIIVALTSPYWLR